MKHVLVVHGPNLNLLGSREPEVYGSTTLSELEDQVAQWGAALGLECTFFQSNHEGELIDAIHESRESADGILINAGALTHYSYALHDALVAVDKVTVEVHISNVHAREPWRRHSVTAPATDHVIYGRGVRGYHDGLRRLIAATAMPAERLPYGEDSSQFGELRLPERDGPHPVAILLHGGFWHDVWTLDLMDSLAVDLSSRGWATWNVEYRRVGSDGGWPTTMEDVGAATDFLATMPAAAALDLDNVVTVGHSAGGQLALWSAARPQLRDNMTATEPLVRPHRIVALAPVTDMADAHRRGLDEGAVQRFLRRSPADGPERYAGSSPIELLPLSRRQLIVHGGADDRVPLEASQQYVANAQRAGDDVTLHSPPDADHFVLIDAESAEWAAVVEWLES